MSVQCSRVLRMIATAKCIVQLCAYGACGYVRLCVVCGYDVHEHNVRLWAARLSLESNFGMRVSVQYGYMDYICECVHSAAVDYAIGCKGGCTYECNVDVFCACQCNADVSCACQCRFLVG